MNLYAPPYVMALMPFLLYYIPLFNTLCLIFSVFYWRRAELKLLYATNPQCLKYTKEQLRAALEYRRANYFFSLDLPLCVAICPLKLAVNRKRGPSAGPFVVVLLAQWIPIVSFLVAFWYAFIGLIELGRKTLEAFRRYTPSKVKNTLFTQWF